ncbi:golgin subfamily A member 6-like protein 22 [Macrobrachium nipponense]|uniref:golgin subfamily A member 6-like protein 22 n=1 Tax=Macrobrachium nipponense TaxID=159736 RepID=UPI0030C7AB3F
MSWDRRARQYQKFLKSLKRPESSLCSCPFHIHPRHWIPPPCMTSRAQEEERFYHHRRVLSNPELKMRSSTLQTRLDDSEHQQESLQHLYNEARILKEAFSKFRHGDAITRDSRKVIKKWSGTPPPQKKHSEAESQSQGADASEQLAELDRSFAEAVQKEEALKEELRKMREMAQKRASFEEENKKLKKKIRQLQHRIKRQDEAQRASHESLQAEREMGSRDEYILLSLKKKYDDLLQYVLKVESENQKLKSLHGMSGDGDEFLHDYDRRNSDCEHHEIIRLQANLETLRSEMIKKDGYIAECEERLQAMEALKEENLTLHKSLKSTHERATQPDPRDISTALEDEWMRRLAETREMYERAIEGYRDQLQEVHGKLQETEHSHASHIQELMQTIDELKKVGRWEETFDDRTSGHDHNSERMMHENDGVRRGYRSDGEERGTRTVTIMRDDDVRSTNVREEVERNGAVENNIHDEDKVQNERSSISEETENDRTRKTVIEDTDKTKNGQQVTRGEEDGFRKQTVITEDLNDRPALHVSSAEGDKASISSGEVLQGNLKNSKNVKAHKEYNVNKEVKLREVSDKVTQTSATEFQNGIDNARFEDAQPQADVRGAEGEMRESKEYLERVNHLVKKLESMKLNGEGAEEILAVIRDTINDCLHEWRESFHHQKSLQKDSADENKGYLELQRKLRSKSKQLESKQKQCKLLEEQNAKLTQKCSKLEAQITAAQTSDRLLMLQDLPQILHNTELKLTESQETFQRAQLEKNSLQEQIMNLSEKLHRKEAKLTAEHEKVLSKEEEIENLQKVIASLKHKEDETSREVTLLREQLLTKDALLEHTSAQLEERIRECGRLSSQIDRQMAHSTEEARSIQVRLSEQESSSHKQLIEAQALASRYQAQLSVMRSEKDNIEKSLRQNIRKLEEQIDQLQLKNSTLQRQLSTITSTYHNMFASVDISPLNPRNFDDSNIK